MLRIRIKRSFFTISSLLRVTGLPDSPFRAKTKADCLELISWGVLILKIIDQESKIILVIPRGLTSDKASVWCWAGEVKRANILNYSSLQNKGFDEIQELVEVLAVSEFIAVSLVGSHTAVTGIPEYQRFRVEPDNSSAFFPHFIQNVLLGI